MPKFRKKPVVIEAVQYLGNNLLSGVCECAAAGIPHCHTLEGTLKISLGDWIITGIQGERYPCKPDIFEATYERVSDNFRVAPLALDPGTE